MHALRLTVVVFFSTACKATQRDPNFQVVARVEAFIAGWGLEEVLKRSHAYVDAGADAILMHSKRKDPSEIKAFMDAWDGRAPVVSVFFGTSLLHQTRVGSLTAPLLPCSRCRSLCPPSTTLHPLTSSATGVSAW